METVACFQGGPVESEISLGFKRGRERERDRFIVALISAGERGRSEVATTKPRVGRVVEEVRVVSVVSSSGVRLVVVGRLVE